MPLFRIETPQDASSGRYGIAIYFPADSTAPYVTTAARYMTAAAAETDILAIIASAANSGEAISRPTTHARQGAGTDT